MATKKSQPEKTAKFTDLEPVAPASKPADLPAEGQVKGMQRPDQATDQALNAETLRLEKAHMAHVEKAKEEKTLDDQLKREAMAAELAAIEADLIQEKQHLELTVDELTQGIDMALDAMAAGATQSEAIRRAAQAISKQKQETPS